MPQPLVAASNFLPCWLRKIPASCTICKARPIQSTLKMRNQFIEQLKRAKIVDWSTCVTHQAGQATPFQMSPFPLDRTVWLVARARQESHMWWTSIEPGLGKLADACLKPSTLFLDENVSVPFTLFYKMAYLFPGSRLLPVGSSPLTPSFTTNSWSNCPPT